MLNANQQAKIEKFINDPVMSEAVYDVLLQSFIKIRPRAELGDTEEKSSRFIAIQLIQETWKELEKYKIKEDGTVDKPMNVGL